MKFTITIIRHNRGLLMWPLSYLNRSYVLSGGEELSSPSEIRGGRGGGETEYGIYNVPSSHCVCRSTSAGKKKQKSNLKRIGRHPNMEMNIFRGQGYLQDREDLTCSQQDVHWVAQHVIVCMRAYMCAPLHIAYAQR